MPGWNSITGYTPDAPENSQEALGITRFGSQNRWSQIVGGLIMQGGIVPVDLKVKFFAPFNTQIFGVFINGGVATEITLEGCTASGGGHWFAIGV